MKSQSPGTITYVMWYQGNKNSTAFINDANRGINNQ